MTSPVNSNRPLPYMSDGNPSNLDNRVEPNQKKAKSSDPSGATHDCEPLFSQRLVPQDQARMQASLHNKIDAIEGAKSLIANDENIIALLETVPRSIRESARAKLNRQSFFLDEAQEKSVRFDILNYTNHAVEFDESLNLKIDGKIPKRAMRFHDLKFTPDSCQLVVFEYLGQFYIYDKDLPKNGASVDSTRIGTMAFNFQEDQILFDRARLEEVNAIVPQAVQEFKKRLGLMFPGRSIDEKEIKLSSAESFVFPDGSLGCPRPGLMAGGVEPGFIFTFNYLGGTYRLHTAERGYFLSPDLNIREYTQALLSKALKILSASVQKEVSYTQVKIKEVEARGCLMKSYEECGKSFDRFYDQEKELRYLFMIEFEGKEHRIIFNEDGEPKQDMMSWRDGVFF